MLKVSCKKLVFLALTAGFIYAGSASATITVTDSNFDGSFGTVFPGDITYGNGSMQAVVTPLLFAHEFGNTQPAATQVGGANVTYSYGFGGSGTSVVSLDYTFVNNRTASDIPPTLTDLRFMLDVIALGTDNSQKNGVVTQNWPAAVPGDPSARQAQDLGAGALIPILQSNNRVTDNAFSASCLTPGGCSTDFGLEWDRASLAPGESWTVHLSLVDNPALVTGGRWLKTSSVDVASNVLIVGNPNLVPEPESYAMLLAGLALLATLGRRRFSRLD
jgi:hypothetical protein